MLLVFLGDPLVWVMSHYAPPAFAGVAVMSHGF